MCFFGGCLGNRTRELMQNKLFLLYGLSLEYFIIGRIPTCRVIILDMTRQYKTMQTEMGLRIHQLETELERTNKLLGMNTVYTLRTTLKFK